MLPVENRKQEVAALHLGLPPLQCSYVYHSITTALSITDIALYGSSSNARSRGFGTAVSRQSSLTVSCRCAAHAR